MIDNLPAEWLPVVQQAAADYSRAANLDVVVAGPQQCLTATALASPFFSGYSAWLAGVLEHNNVCLDAHSLAWYGGYWGYTFWQPYNWTPENGSLLMGVEIWLDPARVTPNLVYGQYIVCHELGHALGLGHRSTSDTGSCMSGNYWTPANPHPDAGDLAVIDKQTTVSVGVAPKSCTKRCR